MIRRSQDELLARLSLMFIASVPISPAFARSRHSNSYLVIPVDIIMAFASLCADPFLVC